MENEDQKNQKNRKDTKEEESAEEQKPKETSLPSDGPVSGQNKNDDDDDLNHIET